MLFRTLKTWLWNFATRIAALRNPHAAPEQIARHDWPSDTRRIGIRFSEQLRDTWRPRWLRISRR